VKEKQEEKGEQQQLQQQQQQVAPTAQEGKPKKRVKFNMPFIIGGLVAGILAAAPYTQIGNYFYGVWGFLGGILSTYIISRSYKYFNYAQAAVMGMLSGAVATAIAISISVGISFIGFDTRSLYPAFIKETLIPKFEEAQLAQVRGKIILPPWGEIKKTAENKGENAISDWFVLNGFYLTGTLVTMAIIGGFVGGILFSKPAPKKEKYKVVRAVKRRKEAGVENAVKSSEGEKPSGEQEAKGDSSLQQSPPSTEPKG
jgi:hypothetical protein